MAPTPDEITSNVRHVFDQHGYLIGDVTGNSFRIFSKADSSYAGTITVSAEDPTPAAEPIVRTRGQSAEDGQLQPPRQVN